MDDTVPGDETAPPQETAPTAHEAPVLDAGALARLDDWGGPKLRAQMVRLYVENAHVRMDQLEEGLAAGGDLGTAELAAHSLKSSAANVGLMRVSALAARIEVALEKGERGHALELREPLCSAVAEAEGVITAHLAREPD